MKVLVTGASGFVGSHLVRALLASGHQVRGLSRKPVDSLRRIAGAEYVDGVDVGQSTTMNPVMFGGIDAIVHLVGIIQEARDGQTFQRIHVYGTQNILDKAIESAIYRVIYVSAIGAAADAPSEYARSKFAAEEIIRNSRTDWTIFRPSLILGQDGEFASQMAELIKHGGLPVPLPFPVIPVPGSGNNKFQPVYVDDLMSCLVGSLNNPETSRQVYEIGGATQVSFNEIVGAIATQIGIKKPMLHAPVALLNIAAGIMESLMQKPPVTRDQLKNLKLDNVTTSHAITSAFGVSPMSFNEMLPMIYPR